MNTCLKMYLYLTVQTEMTTAERELDQNTNYDWNRIQESGQDVEPIYGPGYTGLVNLGNRLGFRPFPCWLLLLTMYLLLLPRFSFLSSCYIAATMQVVLSTQSFSSRSVDVPLLVVSSHGLYRSCFQSRQCVV